MTRLKTIFRRARTLLWTAFSIIVILAAVIVGIGQLMMPYSHRYQPQLEAWLSQEFGQPVVIESFTGDWAAFGPKIELQGMQLLPQQPDQETEPSPEVVIESAALDIKPLNLLIPGMPLYNFRVIGADFELLRTADGQFRLSGFGVSRRGPQGESSALAELARVGEVVLEDSSLDYRDERYGVQLELSDINGRVHLDGDEFSTEFSARLFDERSELVYGEIEGTLLMTLDEQQKLTSAAWQATARELMLAAFQGRVPPNPFLPLTGWLTADSWGNWTRADGLEISGSIDLRDAWLINEHQDMELARINSRFNWRHQGKRQWRLHLANFHYDDGVNAWTAPRVALARNTAEDLGLWISADELPLDVPRHGVAGEPPARGQRLGDGSRPRAAAVVATETGSRKRQPGQRLGLGSLARFAGPGWAGLAARGFGPYPPRGKECFGGLVAHVPRTDRTGHPGL
jgi:hypothetical protein